MVQMNKSWLAFSPFAHLSVCTRAFFHLMDSILDVNLHSGIIQPCFLYLLWSTVKTSKISRWEGGLWAEQPKASHSYIAGMSKQTASAKRSMTLLFIQCCCAMLWFEHSVHMSLVMLFTPSVLKKRKRASQNVRDGAKRLSGSVVDDFAAVLPAIDDCLVSFSHSARQECNQQELSLSWKWDWSGVLLFLTSLLNPPKACLAVANLAPPLTFGRTVSVLVLVASFCVTIPANHTHTHCDLFCQDD